MSSEDRIRSYKNKGKGDEELRRRRTEVNVELRKAQKDAQLNKRRNIEIKEPSSPLQELNQNSLAKLSLNEIEAGLESLDNGTVFRAIQAARKSLSKERNAPIKLFIEAGLVPVFVGLLSRDDCPETQFEAAWALTNIASGNSKQTKAVVEAGGVPPLIKLLSSPRQNVVEQCVWALGNIAGDGPVLRDLTTKCGILKPLLCLIQPSTPVRFLRNIAWTLSNLCRNKDPHPSFSVVEATLPMFAKLVHHSDQEVVSDACWALSYLSNDVNERIQLVIESGVVRKMVQLLSSTHLPILTPTLRTIGNIVTGSDQQTQYVIDCDVIPALGNLLLHPKPTIQKEAAWTISNIAAGNTYQIQMLFDHDVIERLIRCLAKGDLKTKKESMWAVNNICSGGIPQQVNTMLECGVLQHMSDLLKLKDPQVVVVALDGIQHILAMAAKFGELERLTMAFEEIGAVDDIELLQQHENSDVYASAANIIEMYFSSDAVEEVEPSVHDGEFQFSGGISSTGFQF